MNTRLQALDRLRALYGVVTHMHSVALEQAAAAVRDAEQRIEAQHELARRSSVAGRVALRDADKPGWMIEESQRGFAVRDAELLGGLLEEREVSMLAAAELYRANRLQLEQMLSVLKGLRSTLERERAHREQRDSDDRFLSRLRWRDRRDEELSQRG